MMKLAFVILSFNHPELTGRCLKSVVEKASQRDAIYLIHNGSQPRFVSQLKSGFSNVTHIEIPENLGFSGGANRGLKTAFDDGATHVLFLTNDTVLELFDADSMRKFLRQKPACLLAPKIEKRDTGKVDSWGGSVKLANGHLRHLRDIETNLTKSENYYVPGTAFVISQSAWDRTGTFDEKLGTYWEDVDYSLRADHAGVFLGAIPWIRLKHGIGKTCHGNPLYSVYFFNRNRRRVVWRHGSLNSRLLFSAVYLLDTSAKLARYVAAGDRRRLNYLLQSLVS